MYECMNCYAELCKMRLPMASQERTRENHRHQTKNKGRNIRNAGEVQEMYECMNCYAEFETPVEHHTTQEALFGVSFDNPSRTTILKCPYCGSDEISVKEEEDV